MSFDVAYTSLAVKINYIVWQIERKKSDTESSSDVLVLLLIF